MPSHSKNVAVLRSHGVLFAGGRYVLSAVVFAGCSVAELQRPIDTRSAIVASEVGLEQTKASWSDMSDSSLWATIVKSDTVVVLGLKEVGTTRGVERGRPTISAGQWRTRIEALESDKESPVISADRSKLPVVRVRPKDIAALSRLRRLPFVDYVEPNYVPLLLASTSGCASSGISGGSGDSGFGGQLSPTFPSGDEVSSTYFSYEGPQGSNGMNVANAWQLATGIGVTIGVTDTGLDISAGSEFGATHFTSGQSAGRVLQVFQSGDIGCSHGTRIAGLAAAPMNARLVAGVAYRSNLVAVKHSDGVLPDGVQSVSAGLSIEIAASNGAKVVAMAWAMLNSSTYVSDVIDYYHYQHDVMFVGAAGTCPGGICWQNDNTALFPSSKEEVLAVTGSNHDGSRPPVNNYGGKSGVIAFTNLATVGLIPGIVNIAGSSGATGFVAGAAALVRSRNPGYTARQTMDAIIRTSGHRCGAPIVWRDAMINVSAAAGGACVSHMLGANSYYVHSWTAPSFAPVDYWILVARSFWNFTPGGSGQYTPQWNLRPEHEVVSSTDGNIVDGSGNLYWQTRRSIRFRPAWDGLPYQTKVEVVALDTPFGTGDRRSLTVLVCPAPNNCSPTTRPWPTPPPPPAPLSVVISGPSNVASGYGYTWTAIVTGGYGNHTFAWTGPLSGTSASIVGSFCEGGSVSVTVTDGIGTATASQTVDVNANEPPPLGGQFVPCG